MASSVTKTQASSVNTKATHSILGRVLGFIYGIVCYVVFFVTFLYAIGFVGNLVVPKGIDSGTATPIQEAVLIDLLLMSVFALQHSVMARPAFKKVWTVIVPKQVERSTYVLLSSLALALLFWQWRPVNVPVWSVANPVVSAVLTGVFFAGWLIVLLSTFMINHFDLFGLRQIYKSLRNEDYKSLEFRTSMFYKFVRHPIMVGFLIAFWATPVMTVGHLLFTAVTSAYIVIAVQLEERDLIQYFGEQYVRYQRSTSMFIPRKPKQ